MQLSEQLDIDIGGYMYKLLIYIYIYIYVCLNINLSPLSYITISLDSEIVKCVVCIKLPIYGYMCLNMKLHCLNRHNFIFISSVNSINEPFIELILSILIGRYLQLEYRLADFEFHTNSVIRKHKIVHSRTFLQLQLGLGSGV